MFLDKMHSIICQILKQEWWKMHCCCKTDLTLRPGYCKDAQNISEKEYMITHSSKGGFWKRI